VNHIESEFGQNADYAIQYLFCEPAKSGDDSAQSMARIQKTILYQLYELATHQKEDSLALQQCNDVFKVSKQKKAHAAKASTSKSGASSSRTSKDEALPDLDEAFESLATILEKRGVFIIIDAIDTIPKTEQAEFVSNIVALLGREKLRVRIVLSCRPAGIIYNHLIESAVPMISMDMNNSEDIKLVIESSLAVIPGWSQVERTEAIEKVRQQTKYNFKYVAQSAIPFLMEPFQRPISKRLAQLPDNMNDTYAKFVRQLSPNYLELLKVSLTWTLLAQSEVSVQEIIDVYTEKYIRPQADDEEVEVTEMENINLLVTQIRDAGSQFLDVDDNGRTMIVNLKDADATRKFCFRNSDLGTSQDVTNNGSCENCKAELNPTSALSLSEKSGHLLVALTCRKSLLLKT
jgi:hypothetical protein